MHVPRLDERIKLKQPDYVMLHRLLFGLTTRRVWERLAVAAAVVEGGGPKEIGRVLRMDPTEVAAATETGDRWWDEVRRTLPEEFTGWLDGTVADLRSRAAAVESAAHSRAADLRDLPRGEAAAALADDPHRGLVFAALDGKPITARSWAAARPEHEHPLLRRSKDVLRSYVMVMLWRPYGSL